VRPCVLVLFSLCKKKAGEKGRRLLCTAALPIAAPHRAGAARGAKWGRNEGRSGPILSDRNAQVSFMAADY
jgi:hypothetical protein